MREDITAALVIGGIGMITGILACVGVVGLAITSMENNDRNIAVWNAQVKWNEDTGKVLEQIVKAQSSESTH